MRRLNIRKRNKLILKEINQKALKVLGILMICLLLLGFTYFYFFTNHLIKGNFEKEYTSISNMNETPSYALNAITIFSSATATPKEVTNSVWNLDVSQYSDIAIQLKNFSDMAFIKQLYIDNISVSKPEYGTPYLYHKRVDDVGKCTFSEKLVLGDKIDYTIVAPGSQNNKDENVMYSDLSNPIVLGYYNQDIKKGFLDSSSTLEYNGTLLKRASIAQASIDVNISMDLHIINEADEEYICNVSIDIPFEDNDKSVYEDGYIIKEMKDLDNYKFLRIK